MMPGSQEIPDPLADNVKRSALDIDDALADAMFDAIAEDTVDQEPSLLRDLRDLSTARRVALVAGVGVAAAAAGLAGMGLRPDISDVLSARYLGSLGFLGATAVALLATSLRGLHRAALGDALTLCLCGVGLSLPLVSAAIPGWWPGTEMDAGTGFHLRCFGQGGGVTAVVTATAVLLMRANRPVWWRLVAAAAAGGLVGTAVQYLNCPSGAAFHLLASHSGLGFAVGAAVLLGDRIRHGSSEQ